MINLAIALALATTSPSCTPEITVVREPIEVRREFDQYLEESGIFVVGLSELFKDGSCTIWMFPGSTTRDKKIYDHEMLHCYGITHEQMAIIAPEML